MLYGVAAAHGLSWAVPVIGTALVGFGLSVEGEATMANILDFYPLLDTKVVTAIISIRNVIGSGITWDIQPWIDGMGPQNTFFSVGGLSFAVAAFAVVFLGVGKSMRSCLQYGIFAWWVENEL